MSLASIVGDECTPWRDPGCLGMQGRTVPISEGLDQLRCLSAVDVKKLLNRNTQEAL